MKDRSHPSGKCAEIPLDSPFAGKEWRVEALRVQTTPRQTAGELRPGGASCPACGGSVRSRPESGKTVVCTRCGSMWLPVLRCRGCSWTGRPSEEVPVAGIACPNCKRHPVEAGLLPAPEDPAELSQGAVRSGIWRPRFPLRVPKGIWMSGVLVLALMGLVMVSRMLQRGDGREAGNREMSTEADSSARSPGDVVESAASETPASFLLFTDPVVRSKAFFEELVSTPSEGLPGLLQSLRSLQAGEQRDAFERALAERWAALNPRAALRYFERVEVADPDGVLATAVFGVWGRDDPGAALAESMRMTNGPARHAAVEAVVLARCEGDPSDAFRLLESLPEDACDRMQVRSEILSRWAAGDAESAVAAMETLDLAERAEASIKIAASWAEKEPREALEWVESQPASDARQEALAQVVEAWAQLDAEAAKTYVESFPPGALRVGMLCSVARGIAVSDPRKAIEWVETNSFSDDRSEALDEIFLEYAGKSPQEALELAAATPDYSVAEIGEEILAAWLRFSRAEPLAWVAALEDQALREQWFPVVLEALAREDPRLAGEYAVAQIPEDGGKAALAAARQSADPREVLRWSEDIEDPLLRQEVMGWAVKHWAELDREEAADFALEAEDAALRNVLWGAVVERWLYEDPHWVAQWLNRAPASEETHALYAEVAVSWIRFDARSASEWVGTLPYGAARDSAVGALVDEVAPWDLEGALNWASVLGDESQRLTTVIRLLEQQAETDASRALELLNTLSMPAETREVLRHHLGRSLPAPPVEPSDV